MLITGRSLLLSKQAVHTPMYTVEVSTKSDNLDTETCTLKQQPK